MIINVSGTSGSGKSTIARAIMDLYDHRVPLEVEFKKRPIAYTCKKKGMRNLFVPGHYETDCGGCDTLSSFFPGSMYDGIYEWIRAAHGKRNAHVLYEGAGMEVLYEGLLMESDVRRAVELHNDGFPLVVVFIDITIEACLDSIRKRREAGGNFKELNPKNTKAKFVQCQRRRARLTQAGVKCELLTREKTVEFIRNLLGFGGEENVPAIYEEREVQPPKRASVFDVQAFLDGEPNP